MLSQISTDYIKRTWITWILFSGVICSLALNLGEIKWNINEELIFLYFFLGLLSGAILAISQFDGWKVIGYTVVFSIAFVGLSAGKIIPPLGLLSSITYQAYVTWMNMRAQILTDQFHWWLGSIWSTNQFTSSLVSTFLIGILLWFADVWLVWHIIKKKRAYVGLLPFGIMLCINIYWNNLNINYLWYFIIFSVALIARTTYTGQLFDWQKRGVDYPEYIDLDWVAITLVLVTVIGILTWCAPHIATPEGWEKINDLFDSKKTEVILVNKEPVETSAQVIAVETVTSLETPNMSSLYKPLPQSQSTVIWVEVSDPPPTLYEQGRITSPAPKHYWRGEIYSVYTGTGWENNNSQVSEKGERRLSLPTGHYSLEQKFTIVTYHKDVLYAANMPVTADKNVRLHYPFPDDSPLLTGTVNKYQVTSWVNQLSEEQLNSAGEAYLPEISSVYLQIPMSLTQRVRQLTARITKGSETPYEKAIVIQDYLRATYPYMQQPPAPPEGQDVVDYFLFDAPGGFCSHYASAMIMMLRVSGVPARLATGFSTGEYNEAYHAYRVPASAAHAWVEVYFPGYEWVEFEPTPAQTTFFRQDSVEFTDTSRPGESKQIILLSSISLQKAVMWISICVGLVITSLAAWIVKQFLFIGDNEPGNIYWHMRRSLVWSGIIAPASITPNEFLAQFEHQLSVRKKLLRAFSNATQIYVEGIYSSHHPQKSAVRTVQNYWRAALFEWISLWIEFVFLRRVFPKSRNRKLFATTENTI